jgi:hypothetical protein
MRCTVTIDAPKWKTTKDPKMGERERRAGQQYRDNEFAAILKQAADKIANTNAHEGTFTRDEISGSYKFED